MDAARIEKGPVAPSPGSSGAGTLVALVFVAVALGLCVAAAAVFAGAVVGAGDLQTDRQQFRDVYVFMVGERAAESLFGGDVARVVGMEVDQKGRRLLKVRPDGWRLKGSISVEVPESEFDRAHIGDAFDMRSWSLASS